LINLTELNLERNQLFYIPATIFQLVKLKRLNISVNSQLKYPNEILNSRDPEIIFKYLRKFTKSKSSSNEIRKVEHENEKLNKEIELLNKEIKSLSNENKLVKNDNETINKEIKSLSKEIKSVNLEKRILKARKCKIDIKNRRISI